MKALDRQLVYENAWEIMRLAEDLKTERRISATRMRELAVRAKDIAFVADESLQPAAQRGDKEG